MTSIIKVDNLQNQCGANIISESANVITIGASGDTVTLAAGASQSGFGRSGSVNWDTTPKTSSPVTAVSGNGYFINTTSGAITVNLPAGVAGSIVAISDYANTAATNNITIDPNGTDKINGVNQDAKITTNGAAITLVYVDATRGWKDVNDATLDVTGIPPFVAATGGTVLTCGDYKTHVFTGPGTFTVTSAGSPAGSNSVEYLVVAGGGGGGCGAGANSGGGGGAGGYRQNYPSPTIAGLPVTATSYPITVGSGGAGATVPGGVGPPGTAGISSIFSTITSTGGGAGGGCTPYTPGTTGAGGSGGGAAGAAGYTGGTGNSPPTSPSQGNNGGNAAGPGCSQGAGGGGAGAVGSNATVPTAGVGGNGSPIATTVFGPTSPSYGTPGPAPGRYFAGGGGGGASPGTGAAGGAGGGGAGGSNCAGAATNGTVNTGGGGGGKRRGANGAGGSGIVVIRYKFQ